MTSEWDEYAQMLRRLATEAPAAAQRKYTEIAAAEQRQVAAANQDLRRVLDQREELERRLGGLDALTHRIWTQLQIPQGPHPHVGVPAPRTAADALHTAADLERLLTADAHGLADARRAAPPKNGIRLALIIAAIAAGLLLALCVAVVLA